MDAVDTIIIDEASMLRADLLDAIDHILQISTHSQEPFGGKKLCCSAICSSCRPWRNRLPADCLTISARFTPARIF